ncbi:MAG: class I SAM-dependent methyltransferase [Bacteroidota bacterium]
MNIFRRIYNSVRWRLGLPAASELLQKGTDESVTEFYNDRLTDCEFVTDPGHYEYPRFEWLISQVKGGDMLEIGCGNGGMTAFFYKQVTSIVAMDVSKISLEELEKKKLPNVKTVESLIENYQPEINFDWIVMSEVIEHLRNPKEALLQVYKWLKPGGTFLITTPHGFWESNEHLQEFSRDSFFDTIAVTNGEYITTGFLRDNKNRRRWLTGKVIKPATVPEPDDFFDMKAIRKKRLNKA